MNCQQITEVLSAERLAIKDLACIRINPLLQSFCLFGVRTEEHPLPIAGQGRAGIVRQMSIYKRNDPSTESLKQKETAPGLLFKINGSKDASSASLHNFF